MRVLSSGRATAIGVVLFCSATLMNSGAWAQDANAPTPDAAPPADAAAPDASVTAAPAKPKPAMKKAKVAKAAKVVESANAGVWAGKAMQVGRAGGYPVTVTLGAKTSETDYPDLGCGGTLTKVGAKGDDSFYIETITKGAFDATSMKGCISGTVTLVKAGDAMIWGWIGTFGNKPVIAYATLTKQAPMQK